MSIHIDDIASTDFAEVIDPQGSNIQPTSPGDILLHEFLQPLQLSANSLAKSLHVPTNRITAILNGSRGVSADTALRLARFFGNSAPFWLSLQQNFDLEMAKREKGENIIREVQPRAA